MHLGFISFSQGKRVRDVINMAGGFTQNAEKDDIYIRYPNGISKRYNPWYEIGKSKMVL